VLFVIIEQTIEDGESGDPWYKIWILNSFLIFQHIGYEHMTGPYIIPIANGDLATDHVSYELIT